MKEPSASVLITGSEVLDGRVPDSNSHLIIENLNDLGLGVDHVLSCTDDIGKLSDCLSFLAARSSVIIISGGLGPTTDDLTRELVAHWLNTSLEERDEAHRHLTAYYTKQGRTFDQSNHKQLLFPKGARIVQNPRGTALGFAVSQDIDARSVLVIALPGVPGELRAMLNESVAPLIKDEILKSSANVERRSLRVFGLPESQVGIRVSQSAVSKNILVSYRASFPEVHVVLKAPGRSFDSAVLEESVAVARRAIGHDYIVADSLTDSMDSVLHRSLLESKLTFSAAESCTGGMVGELMTSMPGSSKTFLGSAVTYSNAAKNSVLGVRQESLAKFGAVSAEVAKEMALGARRVFTSDLAVSITGIAGPDGGSDQKPVGTFYVGYSDSSKVEAYRCFFASTRHRIRRFAAFTALDIVRRQLRGLPIEWEVA